MANQRQPDTWVSVLYSLLLLAALLLLGLGIKEYLTDNGSVLLGAGSLGLLIVTASYPLTRATLGRPTGANLDEAADTLHPQLLELLQSINERLTISDAAKRIAFRERDRETLRQAIHEDIAKGDLDAALAMANEMTQNYGYKREGEDLRQQILASRAEHIDQQVRDAIAEFEKLLLTRQWDDATQEAKRLQQRFPESPRVADLTRRIRDAREQHKKDLERSFLEAARRDDVETAMELLKEMDHYLTEKEAAPLMEVARGVIGKKRQNLGLQFKLAVADHEWIEALNVGEQIIREFPNTKMADEVQSMIDLLRERAQGQQAAAKAQGGF
ncbi:MAG: hypothetical protein IT440_13280 [Phycisphaeraceae bacterium]|nr:hypothetical protein [Phycisphaeraceae bacterium]